MYITHNTHTRTHTHAHTKQIIKYSSLLIKITQYLEIRYSILLIIIIIIKVS